jgi:hypothetical protein
VACWIEVVFVRVVGGKKGSIASVLKACTVRTGAQQAGGNGGVVDSIRVRMIDRIGIRKYPIEERDRGRADRGMLSCALWRDLYYSRSTSCHKNKKFNCEAAKLRLM